MSGCYFTSYGHQHIGCDSLILSNGEWVKNECPCEGKSFYVQHRKNNLEPKFFPDQVVTIEAIYTKATSQPIEIPPKKQNIVTINSSFQPINLPKTQNITPINSTLRSNANQHNDSNVKAAKIEIPKFSKTRKKAVPTTTSSYSSIRTPVTKTSDVQKSTPPNPPPADIKGLELSWSQQLAQMVTFKSDATAIVEDTFGM